MALMSDVDLPVARVRVQVASAIDLVVHTGRLRDAGGSVFQIAGVDDLDGAGEPVVIEVFGQRDHLRRQARAHERTNAGRSSAGFFQPRDQQFGVL